MTSSKKKKTRQHLTGVDDDEIILLGYTHINRKKKECFQWLLSDWWKMKKNYDSHTNHAYLHSQNLSSFVSFFFLLSSTNDLMFIESKMIRNSDWLQTRKVSLFFFFFLNEITVRFCTLWRKRKNENKYIYILKLLYACLMTSILLYLRR